MKIKSRLIGEKINSDEILLNVKNLQLTTTIYSEKFPATKDVGVMTIVEDFDENNNTFYIVIKNMNEEEVGRGGIFRTNIMTKEKEAIITYNINKAYFENSKEFYVVELWNREILVDSYKLNCEIDIYNIYSNLHPKGYISLI